jgi:hyperosmotically inducible periplasmic protein
MKTIFAIALLFAIAACSDSTPPPKPAAPAAPPPQAEAPAAKTPETKAAEAPKPDPNKELARRVKQALEGDGKIQGAGIDVTATEGKVTLWGTTATPGERSRAGQIAAKVDGVSAVDNQLKVVKGS